MFDLDKIPFPGSNVIEKRAQIGLAMLIADLATLLDLDPPTTLTYADRTTWVAWAKDEMSGNPIWAVVEKTGA